jgi:Zn finger protein HypA/HybF involved in hydrogenase expression
MTESNNKLVHAYEHMMERVHARFEELEKTEQEIIPHLQHSIEHAAEIAVELGELTREEARLVSGYLKRDLQDAGHYLADTGHDLREWLRFDIGLIEDRLLEIFYRAADKTRLEILDFEETLAEATQYNSGEITGPGTLQCDNCGERLQFHATACIEPCPRCGATAFSRVSIEE